MSVTTTAHINFCGDARRALEFYHAVFGGDIAIATYADIHAVNPEALTPWKAEMLWQLFVATSNHFSRTLDRDRLHASDEVSLLEQVSSQAGGAIKREVERFLEGFPRRYRAVHSAPEIAAHFQLYQKLGAEPVQT